jgi:hypothetical protein
VEDLVETVKVIYQQGFKDCIDFGESGEEAPKLELNEFLSLKPSLSSRMQKFEEDFNITSRKYDISKPIITTQRFQDTFKSAANPQ